MAKEFLKAVLMPLFLMKSNRVTAVNASVRFLDANSLLVSDLKACVQMLSREQNISLKYSTALGQSDLTCAAEAEQPQKSID